MKFNAALITLAFAPLSYAQEVESMVSSVLDQANSWLAQNDVNTVLSSGLVAASSWLAEHDVNTIVSGALSQVSSFVDNNDLDALLSVYGAPIGITNAEGVSSAWSAAGSLIESVTMEFGSNFSDLVTATDTPSVGSVPVAEATATETAASGTGSGQPAIASITGVGAAAGPGAGASDWTSRAAVVAGSFFLGLVAYL